MKSWSLKDKTDTFHINRKTNRTAVQPIENARGSQEDKKRVSARTFNKQQSKEKGCKGLGCRANLRSPLEERGKEKPKMVERCKIRGGIEEEGREAGAYL